MSRLAAAVAAGAAVLAACGPGPTEKVTPAPQGPFGNLLAWSVAGPDRVFAMTDVEGCASCATLRRWEEAAPTWRRVHDFGAATEPFTDESYELPPVHAWGLSMASDGVHGFVSWDAEGLHQTEDGGRSWQPVEIPELDREVADGTPVVVGDHAVLLVSEPCMADDCAPGDLWRSRLGSASWEPVDQPPGYFYEIGVHGDVLAVATTHRGDEVLFRSTDAGTSWVEVTTPRNTAAGSIGRCAHRGAGRTTTVVECLTDNGTVLRVTADGGRTWRDLLPLGTWQYGPEYTDSVVVIGPERLLVSTPKRSVLVDGSGHELEASGLPRSVRSGVCSDRRTCVVAGDGPDLWRTEDAGRTWRVLADEVRATR